MDLYESITHRKSTRKYNMTPLSNEELNHIKSFADCVTPLYNGIKTDFDFVSAGEVKNLLPIKAPHYMVIYSEKKEGYLTNAGFMFQQVDLFLSAKGLGSCWLGMARPSDKGKNGMEFIIILAFGNALDDPHRQITDFKRKVLSEIATGSDPRLEYARLAPSASNTQPWYFVCEGNSIYVYRQKLGVIKAAMYDKMNQFDMGITLCHLSIASQHFGIEFNFSSESNVVVTPLKGYEYIGVVSK